MRYFFKEKLDNSKKTYPTKKSDQKTLVNLQIYKDEHHQTRLGSFWFLNFAN